MIQKIPGLDEVIEYFTKNGIQTCILYGSAGSSRFSENSDIDIAIAAENQLPAEDLVRYYLKAMEVLHREVDIKDLRSADGVLLKEILTTGKILINDDHKFLGAKAVEMMDFQTDLAPQINAMLKARLEKAVYGK
jgi:predicted nucleotidyltransferase